MTYNSYDVVLTITFNLYTKLFFLFFEKMSDRQLKTDEINRTYLST